MTVSGLLRVASFPYTFCLATLGSVAVSLLAGCSFYDSKGDHATGAAAAPIVSTVDFAAVSKDVFAPKCLSCHASSTGNAGGINLETYARVATETAKIKEQAITLKIMPLGGSLTGAQYNELSAWLDAGAPENVKSSGS